MPQPETPSVTLREVVAADLPVFFAHQNDQQARHMAAFTGGDIPDWQAYQALWARLLADSTIIMRAIVVGEQVAGMIDRYEEGGTAQIGYWLGREYWGRGLATAALRQFLALVHERPLHASTASDNLASISVLQKCGFRITGRRRGYAEARGEEIDEVLLRLDAAH